MERIAAAIVGPAAEETATINEFMPIPLPQKTLWIESGG